MSDFLNSASALEEAIGTAGYIGGKLVMDGAAWLQLYDSIKPADRPRFVAKPHGEEWQITIEPETEEEHLRSKTEFYDQAGVVIGLRYVLPDGKIIEHGQIPGMEP